MTGWELRGYLTHPNQYGKPRPGTTEEANWSRGWMKAEMEANLERTSDYHLHLAQDALLGRDTYAVQYRDEKDLEF
jgi:hypothetical protein